MSLKNKTLGLLIFVMAFVSSCANQSTPTGGPKDEDPPILEISIPEHETLNYTSQKITLEFDEYVKLNNPKEEIIITPRLLGEYNIKYKKNKIIITLEDSLLSNTTYTFNFRESIQDINEGNSPLDFQIAFSTGDYLDSLSLTGNVYNLLSNEPGKNITVSLYDSKDTLDIFNSPPIYFTKSNDSGDFTFNNLKNGSYKIYAINDENKNLQLEASSESYSYLDHSLQLDSNINTLKLPLINLDNSLLELQSSKTRGHYFVLKYNKYISTHQTTSVVSKQPIPPSIYSDDHREIIYYNQHTIEDSLALIINAYDTINNITTDTVYIKFEETKRDKAPFEAKFSKVSIDKDFPRINTQVNFTKPILSLDLDSLYFQLDSITHISFDSTNLIWNDQRTILSIDKSLDKSIFEEPEENNVIDTTVAKQNSKPISIPPSKQLNSDNSPPAPSKNNDPRLYFGQMAFLSVEQDSSRFHTEKISFINPSSFGTILIKVETEATSFITQLLDTKGNVVSENQSQKEFSFDKTNPSTYKIRVLIDTNGNGKWDIGDINKNILPEPVIFYTSEEGSTEITLRANWELGPNVIKY